jgi:DNA-binding GntR family transcriptional regulator
MMRLYGLDSAAGQQRQQASIAEHPQLIALAESGDKDGILSLITRHILDWEPVFTTALKERLAGSGVRSRRR